MPEFPCPVCTRHVFEKPGDYEICPVCGWENDSLQWKDPDFAGGANRLSLNQARAAWQNAADRTNRKDESCHE